MNRIRRYRDTGVNEVAPKDDHRIDAIMKELEYLRSELAQKKVETSISKYFNEEIFTKDREDLLKDGFVSKGDYLEIPLTILNARYKQWCIDSGHNRMLRKAIIENIRNDKVDGVVFKYYDGYDKIRVFPS